MAVFFPDKDDSLRLVNRICQAFESKQAVRIRGGDSKAFLGRTVQAEEIDTRTHTGIVDYDPTELVVTVRAGTPVSELNGMLAANGQHLTPEAPDFNGHATVGGMVASALAGPRRPWSGSVRDHVLGCRVIDGRGRHMRFGGQVMKNVAGYDFSRLAAGSHGCLGLITEVSLKVLPMPRKTYSLALQIEPETALERLAQWRLEAMPISGAFLWDSHLYLRLEGGETGVDAARKRLGGEEASSDIWTNLRERRLSFFESAMPLWRVSVPWQAPLIPMPGAVLLDWAGAQRWVTSDASPEDIRLAAKSLGGHATCYTPHATDTPFQPLPEALLRFHRNLKRQVDPHGILNPGRMYAGL